MSFDKLAFAKRPEGPQTFSRLQAEALTEAFDSAIHDSVATRQDPRILESTQRGEMASLRGDLRGEMADLRSEFAGLRSEFAELRGAFAALRAEVRTDIANLLTAIAETRLWFIGVIASVIMTGLGVILTLLRH